MTSLSFATLAVGVVLTTAMAPRPAALLHEHSLGVAQATSPRPLRGNRPPRYPDSLRAKGVEGQVLVKFSTDSNGTPIASTFNVAASTHEEFSNAVLAALGPMKFDGPGPVRLVFRFFMSGSEQWKATKSQTTFLIDGLPTLEPIVIQAALPR